MKKKSRELSRREAMQLLGAAGLSLFQPGPLVARALERASRGSRPARARSVIQIWMWGGPSHLDTFDPKPEAGYDYCGPYKSPLETNVPGIRICEALPLLAKQADKYSLLRSLTHGINAHETASYMVQTGREPDRHVFPCAGAVVSQFKGGPEQYQGVVPPYVVMTKPQGRFSEAGFLGPRFKPFVTGGDPNLDPFEVEGLVARGISDQRQLQRREFLHRLDSLGQAMPGNPHFQKLDRFEEEAYAMMFGEARKVFDLSTEPAPVRERYGRNKFGQACLMARRLVEHGVPFITINYDGWDTHKMHFQIMKRQLPIMDQGMAALLQDLSERGLLENTILWWSGEFGRGPRIQWQPPWNGGRSHHGKCFSALVAGGGFRGGHVVGASDPQGMEPAERPIRPGEVIGSIYHLLGIDPAAPLPNPRGLQVPVLPPSDGLLKEIL